ncbi:MAG: hypothetical protein JJU24_08225 [Natronohydrobacter sp.]|nr:hypothetical protein [Natronohydrobacter sp.]
MPDRPAGFPARPVIGKRAAFAGCSIISHDWTGLGGVTVLCWTIHARAGDQTARRVAQNITFENYLP